MSRIPEVLIVGAGVIGASVAWHLASRGFTDVRVIDQGRGPGEGSTTRATGGFRAQFGSTVNVELSLLSRQKLLRFQREVGGDPGYRPKGYLFLADAEDQLHRLREAQRLQHAAGLAEARMVGPEEARRLNPNVDPAGILGGAFCPTDGFIDPSAILHAYTAAANRLGVRFDYGVPYTPRLKAGAVVNAAGAWAASVCDVPIRPLRRQVLPTVGTGALTPDQPMTIFARDAFHFRVRDGRVLLLWPGGFEPTDPFDIRVDPAWLNHVETMARTRLPGLAGVRFDRAGAWAGLYDMSPDEHALLGHVGSIVVANGSSGHGVMHAPALGQLAAELILDGKVHSIDATPLRPSRFAENQPMQAISLF